MFGCNGERGEEGTGYKRMLVCGPMPFRVEVVG